MKEISMFDVIGPNMIGPSSSHTAGAVRIGLMAKNIVNAKIKKVEFVLYGSFAKTYKGHGTDRALLAGLLGFLPDDERIKESFAFAKMAGLEYVFLTKDNTEFHPNTVELKITDEKNEAFYIRGESIGGGEIVIRNINGIDIDLTGAYHTILVKQKDAPGVVSFITQSLAKFNVNIAFMKLYREEKGAVAYTIVEADHPICEDVIQLIEGNEAIEYAVSIPRTE